MIVMVISCCVERERRYIVRYSRDIAGRYTDEKWDMIQCASLGALREVVQEKVPADMICVDITVEGALKLVTELRKSAPAAYIILIASADISPLVYLRPAVGAQSLMLKPLSEQQIQEVLSEAIRTYARQFYHTGEDSAFVIENSGGRSLIDYGRILFFEARDKRVYLNTAAEEYAFYDTLDNLEGRLKKRFLRCHRSFLVNREKISGVFLSQNRIVLEDDFEVPLSRTYKPAVKEYLDKGERKNGGKAG